MNKLVKWDTRNDHVAWICRPSIIFSLRKDAVVMEERKTSLHIVSMVAGNLPRRGAMASTFKAWTQISVRSTSQHWKYKYLEILIQIQPYLDCEFDDPTGCSIRSRQTLCTSTLYLYKWDQKSEDQYVESLQSTESQRYFDKFLCDIVDNCLNSNQVVKHFYQYLEDITQKTFEKRCRKSTW